MGINHILLTNAQQKSQHRREKVTIVVNVSQKQWMKSLNKHTTNWQLTNLSAIVSENDSCWTVNIEINDQSVIFKLDTGAEVTAITEATLAKLGNVKLSPVTNLCVDQTESH